MARDFPRQSPGDDFLFVVRAEVAADLTPLASRVTILSPPNLPSALRVVWEYSLLPIRLRQWKPDVVFGAFNLLPSNLGSKHKRRVVMITNLLPFARERREYRGRTRLGLEVLRTLTRGSIRRADRVLLLAPHAASLIGGNLLKGKETILPPALPDQREVARKSNVESKRVFVVASDLYRLKSVETAIRAMASLPDSDLQLHVFGRALDPTYARFLHGEIARLGLEKQVVLAGYADHQTLLQQMADSVACLAPSRFENLSHVLLETLAVGAPLIVADIPGVRQICGEGALYFQPGNPDALAEAMRRVSSDAIVAAKLVSAGRQRFADLAQADQGQAILDSLH